MKKYLPLKDENRISGKMFWGVLCDKKTGIHKIGSMAELEDKDIVELVRITTLLSNCMKKKFEEINEDKSS